MEFHEKIKVVHDAKIKIYAAARPPYQFCVVIEYPQLKVFPKKNNRGEYKYNGKTVNKGIKKAVDYVYEKLKNEKTEI